MGDAMGQNLVPNAGFEMDSVCPNNISEIYYARPWFQPHTWNGNTANSSSSDLYNFCDNGLSRDVGVPWNDGFNSYQLARTGHGYSGIIPYSDTMNYREYIEIPLIDTLVANSIYCVKYYVSLLDDAGL